MIKFQAVILILAIYLLAKSTSTQTCSTRYFDEYSVVYWKNLCFPVEKNITHIATDYKEQACRFYCDRITSCLFYQYQEATTRCALCVFYYTDVQQHQLQVNDVIQTATARRKTGHETHGTQLYYHCSTESYGSRVQTRASSFHYGLTPYVTGNYNIIDSLSPMPPVYSVRICISEYRSSKLLAQHTA